MTRMYLCCLFLSSMLGIEALAQGVDVREETLPNGMRLLLVERHDSPTVACGWVAHVGSVNEQLGMTGIAHLFEHMMFKGTQTIGTTDFKAGQEIQKKQDAIWEEMEEEYNKLRQALLLGEVTGNIYDPENMTDRLRELRAELEGLFEKEAELIVKDEMDQIYTREGGARLNAGTAPDLTAYFVTLPANKLELWFWLESDRLLNPVFREFYSERAVVREERRLRVESTPTGRTDEIFESMFWQSAPYNWPVIGWASDVESINRKQAEAFFDTYYAPNNLTVTLVGDFDSDRVISQAKRYFGRIPRGREDPPPVITFEIEQIGEKRLHAEIDSNPMVRITYHTVPFNHKESFVIDVIADLLSGRTGRLFGSLVEEQDIAVGVPSASQHNRKYAGSFSLGAQIKQGHTAEEVESALLAELEILKTTRVSQRELQKVKNQAMANSFRSLRHNFALMQQLLIYEAMGSWRYLNDWPRKVQEVTGEDIQRVAKKYFGQDNRNVLVYTRKGGTDGSDLSLDGLPTQQQNLMRSIEQRIKSESSLDRLESIRESLSESLDSSPDELKIVLRQLIQNLDEKLEMLRKDAP